MSHQRLFTGVQKEEGGWLLEAKMFSFLYAILPRVSGQMLTVSDTTGYKQRAKPVTLRKSVN